MAIMEPIANYFRDTPRPDHDACWINRVAPTAMVMCPCVDGLSHNEAESASAADLAAGARVLAASLVHLADR